MATDNLTGTDQKAFLADLHLTLADSQRDVLEAAVERVAAALKGGTEATLTRLAKEIAEATGCTEQTGLAVLKCVAFLAMGFVSGADISNIDESIEALRKLAPDGPGGLEDEEVAELNALLKRLAGEASRLKRVVMTGRVIRGVLPMFQDLQATVELRSTRQPISEDKDSDPTPLELVPIASLRLILDSGDPQDLGFQATDEDLAEIQRRIELVRKELKGLMGQVMLK